MYPVKFFLSTMTYYVCAIIRLFFTLPQPTLLGQISFLILTMFTSAVIYIPARPNIDKGSYKNNLFQTQFMEQVGHTDLKPDNQ